LLLETYTIIMKKGLDSITVHEAGHAVAHILTGIPFKYVTIKSDEKKDEQGVILLALEHVLTMME